VIDLAVRKQLLNILDQYNINMKLDVRIFNEINAVEGVRVADQRLKIHILG
jgi:hypothetical protein